MININMSLGLKLQLEERQAELSDARYVLLAHCIQKCELVQLEHSDIFPVTAKHYLFG